ncbi:MULTISPECIES: hypothetical protein [Glutamicibacter]|uniref:hypothetical protein n=1 Tax=Glutamicibacter TaxID=1742989 RepID=UPI003FD1FB23
MSDLPGNPYANMKDGVNETRATLALAYEQRTASLIALMADEDYAKRYGAQVSKEISKRLGLSGNSKS